MRRRKIRYKQSTATSLDACNPFGTPESLLLSAAKSQAERWVAAVYGVLLGLGFMLSRVVSALGVGFLGLDFSKSFPVMVTVAHAVFGTVLGWLSAR